MEKVLARVIASGDYFELVSNPNVTKNGLDVPMRKGEESKNEAHIGVKNFDHLRKRVWIDGKKYTILISTRNYHGTHYVYEVKVVPYKKGSTSESWSANATYNAAKKQHTFSDATKIIIPHSAIISQENTGATASVSRIACPTPRF